MERQEPCRFDRASDGRTRCLPPIYTGADELFLDPGCTDAVYTQIQVARCEPGNYIVIRGEIGCDSRSGERVHLLGDVVVPVGTLHERRFDGSCVQAATPEGPLYRLGAEVAAASFVAAEERTTPGGGRIDAFALVGDDGTRELMGWSDRLNDDRACIIEPAEDGTHRCFPQTAYFEASSPGTYHADASCSSPLFTDGDLSSCLPDPARYLTRYPERNCPAGAYGAWEVGPIRSGPSYSGAECTEAYPADGSPLHEAIPVEPSTFIAFERVMDTSVAGRLQPMQLRSDDDGCFADGHWDSQLGIECSFQKFGDGYRCVPVGVHGTWRVFSDASCTEAAPMLALSGCVPRPVPQYVASSAASECDAPIALWKTGQAIAAGSLPPLWQTDGGSCVQAVPYVDEYVELTAVDPTLFVAAEVSIE